MERRTGLTVRPTLGINYSKNDYRMKDVQMRNETGDRFIEGSPKRFHDGYFSFLAQLEAGFIGKAWADELFVSASYSKTDKELQTGSVQTKVYGMAERNSDAWSVSARYDKHDFLTDRLTLKATLSHTWDHSVTVVRLTVNIIGTVATSSANAMRSAVAPPPCVTSNVR